MPPNWLTNYNSDQDLEELFKILRQDEAERARLTTQIASTGVGREAETGQPIAPNTIPVNATGPITAFDLQSQDPLGAYNPNLPTEADVASSNWLQEALKDTPQTEPGLQVIDPYVGHTRLQVGAASGAARLPLDLASMLMAPGAIGARELGWEGPANLVGWMRDKAEGISHGIQRFAGVGDNADPSARLLTAAGEKFLPAGPLTVPLGLANTAVDLALGPEQTLGERIAPNEAQIPPDQRPGLIGPTQPPQNPYPSWLGSAIAGPLEGMEKSQAYKFITGQPTTIVGTSGGPAEVKTSELYTMGGLAVATLGMMFVPRVYSRLRSGPLPAFRPVENAAPGTVTISSPLDLARTYDDVNAGALRTMERATLGAGQPTAVVDDIRNTFRIQTRANAQALADSTVIEGRMETPTFRFNSPAPLAQINERMTQPGAQYLHLRDTFDDINVEEARLTAIARTGRQVPPGPPTVRGYTMPQVLTEMHQLEQAHPEVRQLSQMWNANLAETRRFQSTGEYGTLSPKEMRRLNRENPNAVPFEGQRVIDDPLVERGNPAAIGADRQRIAIRERLENEAKGMYIDGMNRINPGFFVEVSERQLKRNPHWRENTVELYRRGVKKNYTADPFLVDVLTMDPYYMSGMAANGLYGMKRVMEATTTGAFAPWFAVTSMIRNHHLALMSIPEGMRGIGPLSTLAAVPRQLLPPMASAVATSLERSGSMSWLRNVFGNQAVDGLSNRLAYEYSNSLYHQLQSVGSHRGSIMEQQVQANTRLSRYVNGLSGPARTMWEGYTAMLNAMHNAPSFAFARKNYGRIPLNELALEARRLTGDPRTGGQFYGSKGRPIRFQDESRSVSHTATGGLAVPLARGYGRATEVGRVAIPWYNATTQGMKRVGEAYLENPVKFMTRAWLYAGLPAAATYLMANVADKDPNGLSYVDYAQNRRSDYKKTMNFYIPLPGLPAEQGIEFPRPHEMAVFARLMESAMDHMFRTNIFTEKEDFKRTLQSFLDVAITPPAHPLFNFQDATQGISSTGGLFSGEFYQRKEKAFDQTGGLPANLELMIRSLAPGLGDLVGAGAAAYTQTPEGFFKGLSNAGKEVGQRAASKAPILRDVLGVQPPVSGMSNVTDELFKREKVINQLDEHYKREYLHKGMINVKPKSVAGGNLADVALPGREQLPVKEVDKAGNWMGNWGVGQPPPTNPLYIKFMEEVHNKFKKDAPAVDKEGNDIGGIGFGSLWRRYGSMTSVLNGIRNINAGNYVTWQNRLRDQEPEVLDYLKENKVDSTNLNAVRNFAEKQRQDAARVILFTIRGVEEDMSKAAGRPIKLEDIAPYKKVEPLGTGTPGMDIQAEPEGYTPY